MKHEQVFELFQIDVSKDESIGVMPGPDRTLLYGYDTDRRTWHVWQDCGWLHVAIYIGRNPSFESHSYGPKFVASSLIPNKRLYPEACDFDFCVALRKLGMSIPFLPWGGIDPAGDTAKLFAETGFYGRTR